VALGAVSSSPVGPTKTHRRHLAGVQVSESRFRSGGLFLHVQAWYRSDRSRPGLAIQADEAAFQWPALVHAKLGSAIELGTGWRKGKRALDAGNRMDSSVAGRRHQLGKDSRKLSGLAIVAKAEDASVPMAVEQGVVDDHRKVPPLG